MFVAVPSGFLLLCTFDLLSGANRSAQSLLAWIEQHSAIQVCSVLLYSLRNPVLLKHSCVLLAQVEECNF